MDELGELDAQRELDALLDRVERGEEFSITRLSRPVARLVPWKQAIDRADSIAAIDRIRKRESGSNARFDLAEFKRDRDAGRP